MGDKLDKFKASFNEKDIEPEDPAELAPTRYSMMYLLGLIKELSDEVDDLKKVKE